MTKSKHLGDRGEAAAQRLLDAHDLGSGFDLVWVLSAHDAVRRELRHRLADVTPELVELSPRRDGTFLTELDRRIAELATGTLRPVIWIEGDPYDEAAWLATLAALNQVRNDLMRRAPYLWIIAGPEDLGALAAHRAADFWSARTLVLNLNEPMREQTGGRVSWLHLSDLHFREKERWERQNTLDALRRIIDRDQLKPALVFVTGDVAFSGKPSEYDQAELFFARLAQDVELDPRERFFVVPGNHDVDRSLLRPHAQRLLDGLSNQLEIADLMADPESLRPALRHLQNFCAFTQRLLGPARAFSPERLGRGDVVDVDGLQVGVLCLDSAWAATGISDKVLVGDAQVHAALKQTDGAVLRVVLLHHPISALRDFDQEQLEPLLSGRGAPTFILRGHRHKTSAIQHRTPGSDQWEFAAGATYVGGTWPKGFLFSNLDLETGIGEINFYAYSPNDGGYWHADPSAYQDCRDGVWSFQLPQHLRLGPRAASDQSALPLNEARQRTLIERYRDAAAVAHGTLRCVGVAARSDRPNVTTPALFVPLKFKRQTSREESLDMAELRSKLAPISDQQQAERLAVLGDPGSGKTTLCRFLAATLAREPKGQTDRKAAPLPLYLPFRDYVFTSQQSPELSIVSYLELATKRDLSVAFPQGFLEQRLERGEVVLLLDGLDEVGQANDRATMRDRVLGFCQSYPRVPVLVTSRATGYGEAPLPQHAFEHLEIAPFDDAAIEDFVRRWYAVQEPESVQHRSERIADLLAALEAEPRVKELARNPLLCTLIALIHRSEAHLPGERAELFERCVQTLLVDWPAAHKRTFGEIDEGWQRNYLETLALEMQRKRDGSDNEHDSAVVIHRKDLEQLLKAMLGERHDSVRSEVLARKWIRYLEEGTGILVEQRPGVFGFLHLSLMEYLAACAWQRELGSTVVTAKAIVSKHESTEWREVCLLAVGRNATDAAFLDALFEGLDKKDLANWVFLLECMREEAAFKAEQRDAILDGAGAYLLRQHNLLGVERAMSVLGVIRRFSRRHRTEVHRWLERRIRLATGRALLRTVSLPFDQEELVSLLSSRHDSSTAASVLLQLFPGTQAGQWAAGAVSAASALDWLRSGAGENVLVPKCLAILSQQRVQAFESALVAYLCWRTSVRTVQAHASPMRPGVSRSNRGVNLPEAVRLGTCSDVFRILPTGWLGITEIPNTELCPLQLHESGDRENFNLVVTAGAVESTYVSSVGVSKERDGIWDYRHFSPTNPFATVFAQRHAQEYVSDFRHTYDKESDSLVSVKAALTCARILARDLREFASSEPIPATDFTIDFSASAHSLGNPSPAPSEDSAGAANSIPRGDVQAWVKDPHLRARLESILAVETWIALVTTLDRPQEESARYLIHRIQSRWLNLIWPEVDKRTDLSDPIALALYLALGWSQATVTHEWPRSEQWRKIFGQPPPEHWLPRLCFELCHLTHDPKQRSRYDAFFAALEQGLGDTEFAVAAQQLRDAFPPYDLEDWH